MENLKECRLFKDLSDEELKFISNNLTVKKFKKDEVIFSNLDKCNSLNLVLKGRIKLVKYIEGNEKNVSILKSHNFFGEALLFEELKYPVFVIADEDSEIGIIHKDAILKLIAQSRNFSLIFIIELSKKIRMLNQTIDYLSYSNIRQRLSKYFLNLSEEQNSDEIVLKISKQKIAEILGTSREVVSRNFSAMVKERLIKEEKDFIKLDIDNLRKILI